MRKLLLKLGIVGVSFIVYLILPIAMLVGSKELMSPDEIVAMQQNSTHEILQGLIYSNPIKYLKLQRIISQKPAIMALGASVALEIREDFFSPPSRFFNAGLSVDNLKDFRAFLKKIPQSSQPQILLVVLTSFYFHPDHFMQEPAADDAKWGPPKAYSYREWFYSIARLWSDLIFGKFTVQNIVRSVVNRDCIGFNAIVNRNGFRNDGSYLYGKILSNPTRSADYKFVDTYRRIDRGTERFEYGERISEDALNELALFLKECQSRNIYVIGFLSPFPPQVYQKLKSMGSKYEYLFALNKRLNPLFNLYGHRFYDFSDGATIGITNEEVIDGFHCSEKAYLRVVIRLAEKDEHLKRFIDSEYLKSKLSAATSNFAVF